MKPTYEELEKENERLRTALQKIADFDTHDGDKYKSHYHGWHGVAKFARQALSGKSESEKK